MSLQVPENFTEVISEEEIATTVKRLASEIDKWILSANGDKDIVAMPIMRGALFFYADLMRELSHSIEIVPVRCWGYVLNQIGEQLPQVRIELADFDAEGKTILLVDEICDTGRTFKILSDKLLSEGAKVVKTVALVKRDVPTSLFSPDWVGLHYSADDWLVGYGMEDRERYRNLKAVYKKI